MTDEIVTQSIRIVNNSGETVATLGADQHGCAFFVLYDEKGNPGLSLTVNGQLGPSIILSGKDGLPGVALSSSPRHGSHLNLYNGEESSVFIRTVNGFKPRPSVEMIGEAGTVELGWNNHLSHGLVVYSKDGRRIISVGESADPFNGKPDLSMALSDRDRGRDGRTKVWKL